MTDVRVQMTEYRCQPAAGLTVILIDKKTWLCEVSYEYKKANIEY